MEDYLKELQGDPLLDKKNILIVAQTPPPYLGQSIMNSYLVDYAWPWCNKYHIRIAFAQKHDEFKKITISKFLRLIKVLIKLIYLKIKLKHIDAAYYSPSGPPSKTNLIKDTIIIIFLKLLTDKLVFHFHSSHFHNNLLIHKKTSLAVAKYIYKMPALSIIILPSQKKEIDWLESKKVCIVNNGIPDIYNENKKLKTHKNFINIVYCGLLVEKKGIEVAIKAAKILAEKDIKFIWYFIGGWSSDKFKMKIKNLIDNYNINENIVILGEINGEDKWKYYYSADIFCFPTLFELMSISLLEAMMMQISIVTTNIETNSCFLKDGHNCLLVDPNNHMQLAEKLFILSEKREIRQIIAENARKDYLNNYQVSTFRTNMEAAIKKVFDNELLYE